MNNVTLAGPGTGKTTNLIGLIAKFIREDNVDPKKIFAVTFTKAAAAELKNKLSSELDLNENESPLAMTLHAFSLKRIDV